MCCWHKEVCENTSKHCTCTEVLTCYSSKSVKWLSQQLDLKQTFILTTVQQDFENVSLQNSRCNNPRLMLTNVCESNFVVHFINIWKTAQESFITFGSLTKPTSTCMGTSINRLWVYWALRTTMLLHRRVYIFKNARCDPLFHLLELSNQSSWMTQLMLNKTWNSFKITLIQLFKTWEWIRQKKFSSNMVQNHIHSTCSLFSEFTLSWLGHV
jgi:hypothetical protein